MFMNERAGLPQGTELIMEDGKKLVLKEIVGKGASCIVYNAERIDHSGKAHNARVKECFPAYSAITRQGNCLIADPSVEEKFREAKARFREAYNKNVDFRNRSGLTNFTSDPYECYEQNGTVYSVFSFDEGDNYRAHEDRNLQEVFEHAKAIADVIKRYHEAGCLHLDIKPENVLITKPDKRVILFDFDSLVELEVLEKLRKGNGENNATPVLSYSEGFSAPEQIMGDLETIGVVSDVYSVGALVWFKIFGRTPERMGYSFGTKFNFSDIKYPDERYCPGLGKELSRLFQNCLATYPPDRWNDMGEVSKCLEKLIALADVERTYLHCDEYRYNSDEMHFVGRRKELKMLEDAMAVPDRNMVFVSGIGGIGKTELVRYYAHLNKENYDNIAFLHYEHSLEETLCSDNLRINAFEREEGESIEAYFERKLKVLKAVATKKDFIIIDNFDTCEEDEINKCLSLAKGCECKFLITTREDFTQGGRSLVFQIPIDRMEDDAELMELFASYQPMEYSEDETEAIRELFELVDRHTMTVGMLANYIEYKKVLPSTLLCKLKEKSGIVNVKGSVRQEKDQEIHTRSVINHLLDLFDLSEFSPIEEEVIKSLALLGYIRITRKRFFELLSENGKDTDEEVEEAVENLRRRGWLQVDKETRKLYLHAVIRDLVIGELKPTSKECPRIVNSMIAYMERELPSETERSIRERLVEAFMEGIVGDDLSYVRMCIPYYTTMENLKVEYVNAAWEVCEQCEGKEVKDFQQKLCRICCKMIDAAIWSCEDIASAFAEQAKRIIKYAKDAEQYALDFSKESAYLGRFYVELGKELEDVLMATDAWLSQEEDVKAILDLGYQYVKECYDKGEFYIKSSDLPSEDKELLIRMIQEFYLPDSIFARIRSVTYTSGSKVLCYQKYLAELCGDVSKRKTNEYMTECGTRVHISKIDYEELAKFEENKGNYKVAIRVNQKDVEKGDRDNVGTMLRIARLHVATGELEAAEECLMLLLSQYKDEPLPERYCIYDMLIEIFQMSGKTEKAKQYAEELLLLSKSKMQVEEESEALQGRIMAVFRLYELENNSKRKERLWKKSKRYYEKWEKNNKLKEDDWIGEELMPFLVEYLSRLKNQEEQIETFFYMRGHMKFDFSEEKIKYMMERLLEVSSPDKVVNELYIRLLVMYCEHRMEEENCDYESVWRDIQYAEQLCDRLGHQDTYCRNMFNRAKAIYYRDIDEYDECKAVQKKCNYYMLAEEEGRGRTYEERMWLWDNASDAYQSVGNYVMQEKCLRECLKQLATLWDKGKIDGYYAYTHLSRIKTMVLCCLNQQAFGVVMQEGEKQWDTILKCMLWKLDMIEGWDGYVVDCLFEIGESLKTAAAKELAFRYYFLAGICYLTQKDDYKRVSELLASQVSELTLLGDVFCQMMRRDEATPEAVDKIIDIYDSIKDLLSEDPHYADLQEEFTRFLDKHQRSAVEFRRE